MKDVKERLTCPRLGSLSPLGYEPCSNLPLGYKAEAVAGKAAHWAAGIRCSSYESTAVTMQLIVFLITDAIQFSMWTNPRVEDLPDHLANNV